MSTCDCVILVRSFVYRQLFE